MMNLAILGTDAEILRLAQVAVSQGHRFVWLGDVRPAEAAGIHQLAPRLTDRASEWELLLDQAIADGVLVGRGSVGDEVRGDQLKRLATEGMPLLVVHPATQSVLTYYELDMIRREIGGILQHYNPLAGHPLLANLATWIRDGHPVVGPIHQFTCERHVDDAARTNVLDYLARDVEFIAAAAGDIRRVTAIGPGAGDASFASFQVQMTSDKAASLRWSVGSRSPFGNFLDVSMVGDHGSVTVHVREAATQDFPAWHMDTRVDGQGEQQPLESYDAPGTAMTRFASAVAETDVEQRAAASTWDTATRAMEVVDAANLSLEKGRTIDVIQQQLTERLAFRGAMAALGCGLLLVGFAVVVAVTLLGGAEGAAGQPFVPSWPIVLLVVLAFFLLLQAVPMLASQSKKRRQR